MDEKELQKLYNAISSHFDIGEFNQFKSRMQTPDQRKSFYDVVGKQGFDVGEYSDYETRLAGVKKKDVGGISSLIGGGVGSLSQSNSNSPLLSEELKNSNNQVNLGAVGQQLTSHDKPIIDGSKLDKNDPLGSASNQLVQHLFMQPQFEKTDASGVKSQIEKPVDNSFQTAKNLLQHKEIVSRNIFPTISDSRAWKENRGENFNPLTNVTDEYVAKRVNNADRLESLIHRHGDRIDEIANQYYHTKKPVEGQTGTNIDRFLNDPDVIEAAENNHDFKRNLHIASANMHSIDPLYEDKKIRQSIGQYMEDNGMTSMFHNNPNPEQVDHVIKEMKEKGLMNDEQEFFYNKNIKTRLQFASDWGKGSTVIPTGGASEKIQEGLEKGIGNVLSSTKQLVNLGTAGTLQDAGLLESDENRTARLEGEKYTTPQIQLKGSHAFLGGNAEMIGEFTPMILGEMAGVPTWANMTANFLGKNMDDARQVLPNSDKVTQAGYGVLLTSLDVALSKLLPTKEAANNIKNLVKNDFSKTVQEFASGKITSEAAKEKIFNKVKSTLLEKLPEFVTNLGVNNTKAAAAITGFGFLHNGTAAVFGGKDLYKTDFAKEAFDTFKQSWLSSTALSSLASLPKFDKSQASNIVEMVENPKSEEQINNSGNKEIIDNYNNAKTKWEEIKTLDLSQPEKEKLLIHSLAEDIHKGIAEGSNVSAIKNSHTEKAKQFSEVQKNILNPEDNSKEIEDIKTNNELDNKEIDIRIKELDKESATYSVQKQKLEQKRKEKNEDYEAKIKELSKSSIEEPLSSTPSDESQSVPIENQKNLIQKAIDENVLKGGIKTMAEEALKTDGGEKEFFKSVADQSQNKNGGDFTDEQAKERAVESFGKDLVDKANELFPKEKVENDYKGQHKIINPITTADNLEGGSSGFEWKNTAQDHDLSDKTTKGSYRILKSIQGNPDAEVTIYRSVPKGVDKINSGDWVTLSKTYAEEHGMHETDPSQDMPVISMKVKAKDIGWDGNDLNEFSYHPKESEPIKADNSVVDKETPEIKTRKENVIEKARNIEEENVRTAHDKVLHYFGTGGKINPSAIREIFGSHSKNAEGEKRARIGMIRKSAPTIDQLAHNLWEDAGMPDEMTTGDFKDAIETVIKDHNSHSSAARELIGIHDAVKNELTNAELKEIDDIQRQKLTNAVSELPEQHQEQLVELLKSYQDEHGFIDWERLEKDTNGFDPDILSLPEETQKSLYGLVEKHIQSGQGESRNLSDQNSSSQEKTGEESSTTKKEIIPPIQPIPIGEEGGGAEPPVGEPPIMNGIKDENDPNLTKVANAVNDVFVEGKFGTDALDKVISKLDDTDFKNVYNKVKERIEKGTLDPKVVRDKVLTQKGGNSADQAVLLHDLVNLKNREKGLVGEINTTEDVKERERLQNELINVQNEMMDNALANRMIGRDWFHIGMIRQLWAKDDFSLANMAEQYKAAKGLSELTPEQQKEVQAKYNELRELKVKLEDARSERDKAVEENAKLIIENEKLKELSEKTKSQKKSDRGKKTDEVVKKSNERIQKAKDELKGLRGNLSAGFDPRAAIFIAKIAAEKFYQGAVKFSDLVRDVLDEVKDIMTDWTEVDVRNHLLPSSEEQIKKYYKSPDAVTLSNKELREKVEAYQQLQKEYALKIFEWQKDRRMDVMAKRPLKERLIDYALRWQRFAILSYPTTLLKLGAVVTHGIVFKPFKFALQRVTHELVKVISPEAAAKQTIWGDPKWNSLAKYYSAFIRNFSLANLKEQFSGIDTKEIMYGKGNVYDEWAANKGLLEMPGRSHGYIKSFIKNPEFQFAHEQQISHAMGKMQELGEELKYDDLTEETRAEFQNEFDQYDITKDEVMDRINKLSLEHGKWAILMNDSKFTQKFQNFADKKEILPALVRSELPIVKIPANYVSRAFMTKYGLIKAVTGSKWMGGNTPSIFSIIKNGSKDLTTEQADLLGKALTLGSMGAAFFTLGYLNRKNVEVNDDGSVDIFGVHFSKNLIHSPELESFFSGAETANTYAKRKDKGGLQWIKSFVQSDYDIAKKSPFTNMLKYGFIPNVATALISKDDKDKVTGKISDAIAKKITDMTIPGFVKQPAGWLDTGKPGIHPMDKPINRRPKGTDLERFWQTIELAIPELRKNVPLKDSNKSTLTNVPSQ